MSYGTQHMITVCHIRLYDYSGLGIAVELFSNSDKHNDRFNTNNDES